MSNFNKSDVVDVLFFVSILVAAIVSFGLLELPPKNVPNLVGQLIGATFAVAGIPLITAKLASRKTPSRFRLVFVICSLPLSALVFLGTRL